MITIEKGVPIPVRAGTRETLYPFGEMQAGDSFAISVPEGKTTKVARAALSCRAHSWAKRHAPGAKFTTRAEDDDKAVRIWLLSRPMPLAPIANVVVPPPVTGRVHKLEDDEDDTPKRRGPKPKPPIAFDIPKFADGAAPRAVKGSRY